MCSACHISAPGPASEPPLFTDFSYDNLGVPRTHESFYSATPNFNPTARLGLIPARRLPPEHRRAGRGLCGRVGQAQGAHAAQRGSAPLPEFVKAFGHNGSSRASRKSPTFYNTRDVEPVAAPEVSDNVNTTNSATWASHLPRKRHRRVHEDLERRLRSAHAIIRFPEPVTRHPEIRMPLFLRPEKLCTSNTGGYTA